MDGSLPREVRKVSDRYALLCVFASRGAVHGEEAFSSRHPYSGNRSLSKRISANLLPKSSSSSSLVVSLVVYAKLPLARVLLFDFAACLLKDVPGQVCGVPLAKGLAQPMTHLVNGRLSQQRHAHLSVADIEIKGPGPLPAKGLVEFEKLFRHASVVDNGQSDPGPRHDRRWRERI